MMTLQTKTNLKTILFWTFQVICKGGDFLLYIKRLEPGMAGEVTCELRRALPNQRSVFVNSTTTTLTIVPPNVVTNIVPQNASVDELEEPTVKGKIYSECHEDSEGVYIEDIITNGYNNSDKVSFGNIQMNFVISLFYVIDNIFLLYMQ